MTHTQTQHGKFFSTNWRLHWTSRFFSSSALFLWLYTCIHFISRG